MGNIQITIISSLKNMRTEAICLMETGSALLFCEQIWKPCSLRTDQDLQKYTVIPLTSS